MNEQNISKNLKKNRSKMRGIAADYYRDCVLGNLPIEKFLSKRRLSMDEVRYCMSKNPDVPEYVDALLQANEEARMEKVRNQMKTGYMYGRLRTKVKVDKHGKRLTRNDT